MLFPDIFAPLLRRFYQYITLESYILSFPSQLGILPWLLGLKVAPQHITP